MLMCTETITVVKYDGETAYTPVVYVGVSWYDKTELRVEGKGVVYTNAVKVRIPEAMLAAGIPLPEAGDHIFCGELLAGTIINRISDLAAYKPRRIMSVSDNRRCGLPHILVTGV